MTIANWYYRRHNKFVIFIYKGSDLNPSFRFDSKRGDFPFRGHGLRFDSKVEMMDYINRVGSHMLTKGNCLETNIA